MRAAVFYRCIQIFQSGKEAPVAFQSQMQGIQQFFVVKRLMAQPDLSGKIGLYIPFKVGFHTCNQAEHNYNGHCRDGNSGDAEQAAPPVAAYISKGYM